MFYDRRVAWTTTNGENKVPNDQVSEYVWNLATRIHNILSETIHVSASASRHHALMVGRRALVMMSNTRCIIIL